MTQLTKRETLEWCLKMWEKMPRDVESAYLLDLKEAALRDCGWTGRHPKHDCFACEYAWQQCREAGDDEVAFCEYCPLWKWHIRCSSSGYMCEHKGSAYKTYRDTGRTAPMLTLIRRKLAALPGDQP